MIDFNQTNCDVIGECVTSRDVIDVRSSKVLPPQAPVSNVTENHIIKIGGPNFRLIKIVLGPIRETNFLSKTSSRDTEWLREGKIM